MTLRDHTGGGPLESADTVIETIACRLEQPDFLDILGIAAKRKRDREDADLRMRTRQQQRRELARWVRSFKSGRGNDPLSFLESVRDGKADRYAWGPEVAAAVLGTLVTVTVEIELSTHLQNCERNYRFALTDDGKKLLEAARKAEGE